MTVYGLELCLHSVDEGEPGQGSWYSDSLRAGQSGDLIPRFSAPVQTGSETQPASYIEVNGPFLQVKRPGFGVEHPPPSRARLKKE